MFARPAFSGSVLAALVTIFAFSGLLFFFSQYLQLVRGYSPLQAGLRELPATLASIAIVVVVARVVARYGPGRSISGGLVLVSAGLGLLAVAEGAASYGWLALALAVTGFGVGIASAVTTDAVVGAVPKTKAGAASAISETAYELGLALGIAVLGSLQTVLYRRALGPVTGPFDTAAVRESLATASSTLTGNPDPTAIAALAHAKTSFVHAMQTTSVVAAILVTVGAAIAWVVIPSHRPRTTRRDTE